jgi:hypothetical protein
MEAVLTTAPHLPIAEFGRPARIVAVRGTITIDCASDRDVVREELKGTIS